MRVSERSVNFSTNKNQHHFVFEHISKKKGAREGWVYLLHGRSSFITIYHDHYSPAVECHSTLHLGERVSRSPGISLKSTDWTLVKGTVGVTPGDQNTLRYLSSGPISIVKTQHQVVFASFPAVRYHRGSALLR